MSAAKLVRTFYGQECFAVFSQIQTEGHVREDALSRALRLEVKDLRRIMSRLKTDLIVRERRISARLEEGRMSGQRQIVLSFSVNYKAFLNVTRYKLNYIRDQLNGVDKDASLSNSGYTCSQCMRAFTDLDVGSLFDPLTRSLKCCYCRGTVEEKPTEVAADTARNSLLRFNEQLSDIYAVLTRFEGVQFDYGVLGPEVQKERATVKPEVIGEEAAHKGVIVSIGQDGDEATEAGTEEKSAVPWLQEEEARAFVDLSSIGSLIPITSVPSTFDESSTVRAPTSLASSNTSFSSPTQTRLRLEDVVDLQPSGPNESEVERLLQSHGDIAYASHGEYPHGGNDEEKDYVQVGGKRHHIGDISEDLVARMTADERETYVRRFRHVWL